MLFKKTDRNSNVHKFSCASMYSLSKKNRCLIYFNTNYRAEMKLVPMIMDYCLFKFAALKCFTWVGLNVGPQRNFNFFNVNPPIFQ